MDAQECFDYGFDNGYGIAQENISELAVMGEDEFISAMGEYESDEFRQYSPFEFFAHDVNESEDSESLWESYDEGVSAGITQAIKDNLSE